VKLARTYPDVERLARDLLEDLIDDDDVPVGIGVPSDWSGTDYLQVSCDGTPTLEHPVVAHSTVRVVGWASSTTRAKQLANLALGLLSSHTGDEHIAAIVPLTGVLPARDPDNRGELASVTLRVSVRSTPI
jgi:hypothetical protein